MSPRWTVTQYMTPEYFPVYRSLTGGSPRQLTGQVLAGVGLPAKETTMTALREGNGLAHWVDEGAHQGLCGAEHSGAVPFIGVPLCVPCMIRHEDLYPSAVRRSCPDGGLR